MKNKNDLYLIIDNHNISYYDTKYNNMSLDTVEYNTV